MEPQLISSVNPALVGIEELERSVVVPINTEQVKFIFHLIIIGTLLLFYFHNLHSISLDRECKECQDLNPKYKYLLKRIKEEIDRGHFSTTEQRDKRSILRIGKRTLWLRIWIREVFSINIYKVKKWIIYPQLYLDYFRYFIYWNVPINDICIL